jgi:hypothetical protein
MKRTTLFLDEQTERELQAVARRQKRPVAAVVREALGAYLAREAAAHPAKTPSFVGVGRSGHRTTAERHEDLLWRDLTPHGDAARASRPAGRTRRRRS